MDMIRYLRHNGPHFNRRLYEFAVSKMWRNNGGSKERVEPIGRERYENIMESNGVIVENDMLYDGMYVACMCMADFMGSSISDEKHLAMYVKDVIDDPDAPDGLVFNRWYADMCYNGVPVEWEEML